jgi:hypothetical protein
MRYRLQRREQIIMPNILGNHSMPAYIYTYRWKDIAASDDRAALETLVTNGEGYRIEDTQLEASHD